jgi:quinol monooxygenase YgiN
VSEYVQLAELRLVPGSASAYREALQRQIDAALAAEPGVLSLLAVADTDDAESLRVFEVYRDRDAYLDHVQTPHFLAYKAEVADMVLSLRLIPLVPVSLGARWQRRDT